jgi:hypothetical protein
MLSIVGFIVITILAIRGMVAFAQDLHKSKGDK